MADVAIPYNTAIFTPTSASSAEPTPLMASTSTVIPYSEPDPNKSSSMAPIPEQKPEPVAPASAGTAKRKKTKAGGGDKQKTGTTPPPVFTETFVPSAPATQETEFAPVTQDWFGASSSPEPVQQRPMQDEHRSVLQAIMGWDDIPYGKKWNHYLQHGMVGPSRSSEFVLDAAKLENQGGLAGPGSTYGQELRAQETKRRTLMNQWDKLLADWNAGRYAGDEQSLNYFYGVAENLRNELAAEGVNPNTLRPPSLNAGGFAQGFQKSLQDDRSKLDWLGNWLASIQQHAVDNPNWLNSNQAQMEFDKLSEYVILNWAQSKGAIADAEKVRAQVEAMPPQDRAVFDKFMRMFFDASKMNQLMSLAYSGDIDAMQTLQTGYKFLGMVDRGEKLTDDTGAPSRSALNIGNEAMHTLKNVIRNNPNVPLNNSAAVTSYRDALDAYLNYTMQNANVDRKMVWDSAMDQFDMYHKNYASKMPKLGLMWGWGYNRPNVDRGFGDYLAKWQSTMPTSSVMSGASLGYGSLPKPQNDPYSTGEGGAGAGAKRTPARTPKNTWTTKSGKRAWIDPDTGLPVIEQ